MADRLLPRRRQLPINRLVGLCYFARGSCLGAANGVRGSGHRSRRRRMEAVVVQMSASESRERLFAFVDEVARRLPHVRQRENALLYVRGLIEQGGAQESAADLVSVAGDAGPVRVDAAVSG